MMRTYKILWKEGGGEVGEEIAALQDILDNMKGGHDETACTLQRSNRTA